MLGPNANRGFMGPASREFRTVKAGPIGTHLKIQSSGGHFHLGKMGPPKIENDGCDFAAKHRCLSQSDLGSTSSSVNAIRSPLSLDRPVLRAAFFPFLGS